MQNFIQNPSYMKPTIYSRTLLVTAALLFSLLSCFGQNDPAKQLAGIWKKVIDVNTVTLKIKADNKTEVEFTGDGVADVFGSYEISGTQITLNDEGGDYAADVPGVYEFKVDETSLTFTTVDDPVQGRNMLVEGTWSKAAEAEH
jgi:hypothetical protein